VTDERLGQAVRLLVRAAEPDVAQAVAAHLKSELPNFMQPKDIMLVPEFPRNPNGKIDRVALAKDYGA
jgi:acyl-coenzyme A synthetase/AMP-(fatty) acid ligase